MPGRRGSLIEATPSSVAEGLTQASVMRTRSSFVTTAPWLAAQTREPSSVPAPVSRRPDARALGTASSRAVWSGAFS